MKYIFSSLLLFAIFAVPAHSLRIQYDSGPIEAISEGQVLIRGNLGEHLLEPIAECTWCTVGMEVLVAFDGYTRATIKPYEKSESVRPIRVFIVRDGRD